MHFLSAFVSCCSKFVWEVGHVDELRYMLLHLSGLFEHEKQPAAAKTEAGKHAVAQPGNMSALVNQTSNYFTAMCVCVFSM